MIKRLTLLALAFAISTEADTLRMRDGSTVDGDFQGATQDDIRFSVNGLIQHFARANVAEIIFGPVDTPPAATSTPPPRNTGEAGPDYVDAPFLRGANGYIPLEKEYAAASRMGGVYGMGGGTVYRVQGAHSNVRVRQSDRIVFVVRLDAVSDPRQFQLYRLNSAMGYRQTQPTYGGAPPIVQLNIKKVGDSVFELTPTRALYPGEYAVSPANTNDSYCFGVDY
jgi:hypothetical protein